MPLRSVAVTDEKYRDTNSIAPCVSPIGPRLANKGTVAQGQTSSGRIRWFGLLPVVGVGLLVSACVGNPVPQPPNVEPIDLVTLFYDDPIDPAPGGIHGRAGSVEVGAEVWTWNLENSEEPDVAVAEADGSFEADLRLFPGDELRFQVRTDVGRSPPIDGVATDLAFVPRERPSCVDASLELSLEGRAQDTIRVVHECSPIVDVVDVRWRREHPNLSLDAPPPSTLEPGDPLEVVVTTDRNDVDVEEIVLIELNLDGTPARYPVSVYAADP